MSNIHGARLLQASNRPRNVTAMPDFDFAVVGAGIAGVSLAYHLAPHGRVVILEREHVPAYHTTGRSAALHSETYGSAEIRAITVASGRFYRKPPAGFADHPLLTPRGAVIAGRADQAAAMDKSAAEFQQMVPSVRRLSLKETIAVQPLIRPEVLDGGSIFEVDADDMDVAAIHGGFLKGARAAGAALRLNAEVSSLERKDGAWSIGLRGGESVDGATIVNASGAWADVVGAMAGAKPVGLVPKRRTAFTFDPPADLAQKGLKLEGMPMLIDFDESFYFKPEVGQFLGSLADATPSPPCDAQPEEIDIATAVERIERASTLTVRRIKNKWAGLRSFVDDKNLVVGYDPKVAGFFWLAGQGGYGIQTAEAAGRLAAALALGKSLPSDVADLGVKEAALAPARFNT
jgi:D-arginine dehydrogenase